MARTPVKQISYQVGYNNEELGIPLYAEGSYYSSIRKAKKALREVRKQHPDAFVVRVTEERLGEEG